jgi:cysteine desulfurase
MGEAVYLDSNATAVIRPQAAAATSAALSELGNPSSVHGFGRAARGRVEQARRSVAALVAAEPGEVVFTGGGSEANNLALHGFGDETLLVSAGEHDSLLQAAPSAERLPLAGDGRIDLAWLAARLVREPSPALISVMLANNETGVIQPLAEVAALARSAGALVHCDAVQAAGKIAIDRAALGVDLLSLSAHKLGGAQGVGALVVRDGLTLAPMIRGGGQERNRRAGTENVAGIVGFGVAADLAAQELAAFAELAVWRDAFEVRVRALAPEARVFGAEAPRLANTSCLAMPGVSAETQVMAFDLAGIAVSSGSACSSGKVAPSHVLQAMGVDEATAATALRLSLGWASRETDLERCFEAWQALYQRHRQRSREIA